MRVLVITALLAGGCSRPRSLAPTVAQAKTLMAELGIPCEDRADVLKCTSATGAPRADGFVNLDAADHTKVTSLEIYLQDTTADRATPLLQRALAPHLPVGAMDGIAARLATPHGKSFTIEKVEILAETSSASGLHVQIDYWDR